MGKIFNDIKSNPLNLIPYLEFFIFPVLVLSVMPWDDLRNLSARKRRKAQHYYNLKLIEKWNSDKDAFIVQCLNELSCKN
jgi:hypothetical protein